MDRPRRWVEPAAIESGRVAGLVSALGLPERICEILVRRGLRDPAAVRAFLRPDPGSLHPPASLPDLEPAVARVERARARGEVVLVHGDFDVDGLCAAALLARGLDELGARVEAFVPHRLRDGYDLGPAGLRKAREIGAALIVTADCGVSALAAIETARSDGIDVIVTDHHRPGGRLPPATAVVNPHREDAGYPFRDLAGVGVAFKLLVALFERAGLPEERLNRHLDLVALGTVADRAPLVGENRVLARMGLRALARTRKAGLRALAEVADVRLEGEATTEQVGFALGPRLNAAGRVGSPDDALRLLLTGDRGEALVLARRLERYNRRRREIDRQVVAEATARLPEAFEPARDRAVVLWGEDWHPGVLGLAASRIAERTHRPAVLIGFRGERGRGSARSIEGFHLFRALEACGEALERYGGHAMAAGLEIRRARVETFADAFRSHAAEALSDDDLAPRLRIDLELRLAEATPELFRALRWLAPFGDGHPEPVLVAPDVRLEALRPVGRERAHLQAALVAGDARLDAIGFGLGDRAGELRTGRWEAAFQLEEDRWEGRARLRARLLDLRPARG